MDADDTGRSDLEDQYRNASVLFEIISISQGRSSSHWMKTLRLT